MLSQEDTYICVLYMHARMNELLVESTTLAGGGAPASKAAHESSDHSYEELFRLAVAKQIVSVTAGAKLSWSAWRAKADSYIALAVFFRNQSEPIAAADALARALDLLEVPLARTSGDLTVDTAEQKRSRLSLYVELGRNYYQCNQMEKAIRSMEAVFALDHYHEEARVSLAAWFPDKWRCVLALLWDSHRAGADTSRSFLLVVCVRALGCLLPFPRYTLELEDASQVQVARVIRGIWGRNRALRRRQDVNAVLEKKYTEHPYHWLHRRNVARALRSKYVPLFMAQDVAARRIQAIARRYLYYARIRWALEGQRAKSVQQLVRDVCLQTRAFKGELTVPSLTISYNSLSLLLSRQTSKQRTRKYRYNRHVRRQLAQLLPEQFEGQFHQEDEAAVLIQVRPVIC